MAIDLVDVALLHGRGGGVARAVGGDIVGASDTPFYSAVGQLLLEILPCRTLDFLLNPFPDGTLRRCKVWRFHPKLPLNL
jgi:hypothetical protein